MQLLKLVSLWTNEVVAQVEISSFGRTENLLRFLSIANWPSNLSLSIEDVPEAVVKDQRADS